VAGMPRPNPCQALPVQRPIWLSTMVRPAVDLKSPKARTQPKRR
jgi:hypothetical protein